MNNGKRLRAGRAEIIASLLAFALSFSAVMLFLVLGAGRASGYTATTNTVGVVNVLGTCFIFLTPNIINFGSIEPGSNSGIANVVTDNDLFGNVNANMMLYGTNWCAPNLSTCSNTFQVTNTAWNPTSNTLFYPTVGNQLQLQAAMADTGIVVGFGSAAQPGSNVYFGVAIPPSQPLGLYTQNIIIENSC